MSINVKLAIPALIGMMIILIFIETYWKPIRLDMERTHFELNIQESLVLVESEVIRNLLENDLASVYAAMSSLDRQYQGRWYSLKLMDDQDKTIYPLFKNTQQPLPDNSDSIPVSYDLNVENIHLGKILFLADWGTQSKVVIGEINNIRNLILLLILVALMVTLFSQYQIVYVPLRRLVKATEQIAQGRLDDSLPVSSNDEIGELTQSFNAMMVELRFQKNALDQHAIVSTTDADGVIIYANQKFLNISEYTKQEILGKKHSVIKSDRHPREFFTQMWDTIKAGKVWQGEICNRSSTGKLYWVYSTIVPFVNEKGVCERYISIRTDISASKQIALDLQLAKEAAESGYRAKSDFLANMSHEIRTPMNAIIGFSDLAMSEGCGSQELQEYLEKIQSSSKLLLNLINDILDLSKIENGKMKIESICFDLPLVIEETMDVLGRQHQSKAVDFSVDIHPQVPSLLLGDPNRLGQVLINLVGNAFKFTERGRVSLEVSVENDMILFCVADTGIGMTKDQVETIFDAFTQADVSTTRGFGGTGLCTTISKYIVQQMGGRIWVESEPGVGSKFYFELPINVADELAIKQFNVTASPQSDYTSPRQFKVLLAEDVAVNARLVMLRLEKNGHQVDWVVNGEQAVAAAQSGEYDLVLMDVMMPVMNGRDATQAIRQNEPAGQHLPIIALTASVLEQDRKDCIASGMDAVEFKPINFNQLLRTMERQVKYSAVDNDQGLNSICEDRQDIDFSVLGDEVNYHQAMKQWGDPVAYVRALQTFARERGHIEKIRQSFSSKRDDMESARHAAHNMKGVAENLGMQNLSLILTVFERLLISEDVDGAERVFNSYCNVFNRVVDALQKLEIDYAPGITVKKISDTQQTLEQIQQLKSALATLNPDKVEPVLDRLREILPASEIEPIIQLVAVFDFKGAELKLATIESGYRTLEENLNA